jgi:SAM-dependent methyltransferase
MNAEMRPERDDGFPRTLFQEDSFKRLDESSDKLFYERDRFVHHLDTRALSTVEAIVGRLVVEENPVILDLMASWDSHLPASLQTQRIVGLGLNQNELTRNSRLTDVVIHDLNAAPSLPFSDDTFDIVLNTVSVDYVVKPFELFSEAGRILKPNGLFLVIFSNRMFPEKAVKIWREASEKERVELVKAFFERTPAFRRPRVFVSCGKPRPEEDKYYLTGLPSDPVYAVYADKKGDEYGKRPRPELSDLNEASFLGSEREADRGPTRETLLCPHCGLRLSKWKVPNSPFSTWDTEFLFICFNDECPYLVRGWQAMSEQGNAGRSYRFVYDPERNSSIPIPIINLHALKDGIVKQ